MTSSARISTLMEAAAAHKNAEYERIIDGKEHARREREEEFEQTHQLESAEHKKDLAILNTSRKVTVAAAKIRQLKETRSEKNAKSQRSQGQNRRPSLHKLCNTISAQETKVPQSNLPPREVHGNM